MSKEQRRAVLYRIVTDTHSCPYGLESLDLLKSLGFDVEDHHLKTADAAEAFKKRHGVDTTPQTFIDGVRIGGYDELREHLHPKGPCL